MKPIKHLILLGAAALRSPTPPRQPRVIHIAGSNGDRAATTHAILNLLTSPTYVAGIAATATGSNFSIITARSMARRSS